MEKAYLVAWVLGDEVGISFAEERLACFCFLAGNFDHARRFFGYSQNSLHNNYNGLLVTKQILLQTEGVKSLGKLVADFENLKSQCDGAIQILCQAQIVLLQSLPDTDVLEANEAYE